MLINWIEVVGALSIIWGFLVAVLLIDWVYSFYCQNWGD